MSNIIDKPVQFQYTQDAGEADPKHPLYNPNTIYFVEDPTNKIGTIYLNGIPYREKGSTLRERNPIYIDVTSIKYKKAYEEGGLIERVGDPNLYINDRIYQNIVFNYSIIEGNDYATINPNTGNITWNAYLGNVNRSVTVFISCTLQGVVYSNVVYATQDYSTVLDNYMKYFYDTNNMSQAKPYSDFNPDDFEHVGVISFKFRKGTMPERVGGQALDDTYATYQDLLNECKQKSTYIVSSRDWGHYETTSQTGGDLEPYYATINELLGYYIEFWKWSK